METLVIGDPPQSLEPDFSEMLRRGYSAHGQGKLEEAEQLYCSILTYDPRNFVALHLLGFLNFQRGRLLDALKFIEAALSVDGGHVAALLNRGRILHAMDRCDEALASYNDALEGEPNNAEILNARGIALLDLARPREALESFECALAINGDYVEALGNRGNAMLKLNRPQDAVASYDAALQLAPGHSQVLTNRANALRRLDRPAEALLNAEAALASRPNYAEAQFEASLAQLTLGRFRVGWKGYESRWATGAFAPHRRDFNAPLWVGEQSICGKTILLHAEQGYGDTIQFVRYAPLVAERGAKVFLEVQPELVGLLSQMRGVEIVVARGEPLPAFDFHCPLLSLPLAFGTTLEAIPGDVPYVRAGRAEIAAFEHRLPSKRPRIGVAWAGRRSHKNDLSRSMSLETLLPLLETSAVQFISLQRELCGEDEHFLRGHPEVFRIGEKLGNFAETAAIISLLDIVISVDTAVAHLAGALGQPVFVLLPFAADFRWMREHPESAWYPTARLFRQRSFGQWHDVVAAVRDELGLATQKSRAGGDRDGTRGSALQRATLWALAGRKSARRPDGP
jgi:tetratricopeptide (TPR) repeat protein